MEKPGMFSWTDEAVEVLTKECAVGSSFRSIASKLLAIFGVDLTRNAIIGKAHRLGLQQADPAEPGKPLPNPYRRKFRTKRPPVAHPKAANTVTTTHILDLTPHQCRYVIGDPKDLLFCGQPTVETTSWCEKHYAECYYTPDRRTIARSSFVLPHVGAK